ncbi:TRAP transporter small permease [Desulfospira joergensenii]|uniref:TRAP transporter small permease n=1 Tax=Desulfospira joergensenii TaxID=53329 RepID=UPI0013774BCB|nr:TRAP transporter small permease subunit [Desulfospira joergensenii]
MKPVLNTFGAVDRILTHGFSFLIVLGGTLMTLTVVVQVLLRYVFKQPLFGLEEFSRLVAIWIYFLGAIFSTKTDNHVQGDVANKYIKGERARIILRAIVWTLSLLTCLLFLYHSGTYSWWIYGTGERTTGLWWPRIISVGSMFFGAFFMTLYSLANLIKYAAVAINYQKPDKGVLP